MGSPEEKAKVRADFEQKYGTPAAEAMDPELCYLGFEIALERIVINDVNEGTYFARIILHMQNELGRKFLELDARPSDSIVLALQQKRPIFVARKVFDAVEDMSEILERVLKQQKEENKDEGDE